jgi:hypothetical protein
MLPVLCLATTVQVDRSTAELRFVLGGQAPSRRFRVRLRLLSALAVTTIVIGAGASAASASQSSTVLGQWKKSEAAFSPADTAWSKVIDSSTAPTLANLQKANKTFASAVGKFDTALGKIHFTGKTKSDIGSLIKLEKQTITILDNTKSLKSFAAELGPLFQKYTSFQDALGKDLGIPTAEIII